MKITVSDEGVRSVRSRERAEARRVRGRVRVVVVVGVVGELGDVLLLLLPPLQYCVKKREPNIIAHMKHEKMRPKGGFSVMGGSACTRGDFREADQKKMKRYMVPSKMVDVIARARICGLRRREAVDVVVVRVLVLWLWLVEMEALSP